MPVDLSFRYTKVFTRFDCVLAQIVLKDITVNQIISSPSGERIG